jgi:hypothetical protein
MFWVDGYILSRDVLTIDGVWIGNRIYWTLTELQLTTTVSLNYALQRSL